MLDVPFVVACAAAQLLRQLEVEHAIAPSQRLYCPYKDCSALLMKAEDAEEFEEGAVLCPACKRSFCPNCVACGWHQVGGSGGYDDQEACTGSKGGCQAQPKGNMEVRG